MTRSTKEFLDHLGDPGCAELRESTCGVLAASLSSIGAVLWAFGLADQPRRSIAVAIQMAGELASGSVLLLRNKNRYAAAALVRQLVEVEYLLCLFAMDKSEPLKWSTLGVDDVRKMFMPAKMRKRCGDRFRTEEYSSHCEVGGHPRLAGARLLPEHLRTGPFSADRMFAVGWVDLGQHLTRLVYWVGEIVDQYGFQNVGLASSSFGEAVRAIDKWCSGDPCARLLEDSELAFLAQISRNNEPL